MEPHRAEEVIQRWGSAAEVVDEFQHRGFVELGSVLSADQALFLRELVEKHYQNSVDEAGDRDLVRGDVSLMRMFEHHEAFRDLLVLEPVIDLVTQILGDDCHVIAQNTLRTPAGKSIVNWHIDDALFFPFLKELPCLPPAAWPLPVYSLNVMIALSDVRSEEFGPTQVVAESHLSGRKPDYATVLPPGSVPTSLLARAGDCYLVNSQTWHRGAQNETDQTRYLVTTTYGRRFISQRFFPFLNYRMPAHVLDGASPRMLRLLGKHQKGPYG